MAKLEAQASIVDEIFLEPGIRHSELMRIVNNDLAHSLAHKIIEGVEVTVSKTNPYPIYRNRTDFRTQVHVFFSDKELNDYIRIEAKKMIDRGSVA